MTTESTTTATPTADAPVETPPETTQPQGAPKELREHAERQEAQAKAMRGELLEVRVEGLGLDPKTGLGKAILNTYAGDDVSKEAIAAFAESEYGHKAPEGPPQTPEQQQQTTASQRADALEGQAVPTTPSQAPNEAQLLASQMLDTEKAPGDRDLISKSVHSKISGWIGRTSGQQ